MKIFSNSIVYKFNDFTAIEFDEKCVCIHFLENDVNAIKGFSFIELMVVLFLVLGFLSMGLYFVPKPALPSVSNYIENETMRLQKRVDKIALLAKDKQIDLGRKWLSVNKQKVLIADGYPVAVYRNFLADNAGFSAVWKTKLIPHTITQRPGNVPYHFVYGLSQFPSLSAVLMSECYISIKTHISYPFRPNRLVDYRLSILSDISGCSN